MSFDNSISPQYIVTFYNSRQTDNVCILLLKELVISASIKTRQSTVECPENRIDLH